MRDDWAFEVDRAMDALPHVAGAAWAAVWFRSRGERSPSREEFRAKAAEYFGALGPLFGAFPPSPEFAAVSAHIERRRAAEEARVLSGGNREVERRYERYVDYG